MICSIAAATAKSFVPPRKGSEVTSASVTNLVIASASSCADSASPCAASACRCAARARSADVAAITVAAARIGTATSIITRTAEATLCRRANVRTRYAALGGRASIASPRR